MIVQLKLLRLEKDHDYQLQICDRTHPSMKEPLATASVPKVAFGFKLCNEESSNMETVPRDTWLCMTRKNDNVTTINNVGSVCMIARRCSAAERLPVDGDGDVTEQQRTWKTTEPHPVSWFGPRGKWNESIFFQLSLSG